MKLTLVREYGAMPLDRGDITLRNKLTKNGAVTVDREDIILRNELIKNE